MKKTFIYLVVVILINFLCTTQSLAITTELEQKKESNSLENMQQNELEDNLNEGQENNDAIEATQKKQDEIENIDVNADSEQTKELQKNNTEEKTDIREQEKIEESKTQEKNRIQPIDDGIYIIHSSVNEKKVVNITNNEYVNSTNVNLFDNKKIKTQKFHIRFDENKQSYIIEALCGNKVLDVNQGKIESGSNVQLYEYNGTIAQQWEIKKIDEKVYNIISKNSTKCLDIELRNY